MENYRIADFVADYLSKNGVDQAFLLPGGGAMHLVDAFGKNPDIHVTVCQHEQAVGIAAEACGRIQGKYGVAVVTTGPGATNIITPVVGAWIESVPMLILSGQVKRADLLRNSGLRQKGVQEVDIVTMMKSVTKYAVTIEKPEDIKIELQKAIHLATTGRKGPVWIDIPLDVQASPVNPELLKSYNYPEIEVPTMKNEFARLMDLIKSAKRPLFLAGHGIRLDNAAGDFKELVERLGIPIVTTWNAMDMLHYDHPLNVGRPGVVALRAPNFAVQNCDLLISIGSRLDNIITAFNPKGFARAAKKVVVDIDSNELNKHEMAIELKMNMGAAQFISRMLEMTKGSRELEISEWRAQCVDWKRRYPVNDGKPFNKTGYLSHYEFCDKLSDYLPEDIIVSTGSSGLAVEVFYTVFRNKPGQRVFLTSGLGSMGYGLPAAIGACIANGKKPMVAIESDGSLQLNLQELATVQAQKLPLCLIVLNNDGYTSIKNTQKNYFKGRFVGTSTDSGLWFPDLSKLSEIYGLGYYEVKSAEDIAPKIQDAIKSKRACVVNVYLNPDETLAPKVSAIPQPDGSMISLPLEDMSPLLSLEQLQKEMIIELSPESSRQRK